MHNKFITVFFITTLTLNLNGSENACTLSDIQAYCQLILVSTQFQINSIDSNITSRNKISPQQMAPFRKKIQDSEDILNLILQPQTPEKTEEIHLKFNLLKKYHDSLNHHEKKTLYNSSNRGGTRLGKNGELINEAHDRCVKKLAARQYQAQQLATLVSIEESTMPTQIEEQQTLKKVKKKKKKHK